MGVNLTAIFLIDENDKQIDSFLDKLESRDYSLFQDFYNMIISDGAKAWNNIEPQWYTNDEKVNKRPKLPDVNSVIELPGGILMTFRKDGIEICTGIRARMAISSHPEIAEKAISMYKNIGKNLNVNECWIMGDDNPVCLSFRRYSENTDFRLVSKSDTQKNDLKNIYSEITEGEYEGCYEITGHLKMKINE